jgi:hypothetical protein
MGSKLPVLRQKVAMIAGALNFRVYSRFETPLNQFSRADIDRDVDFQLHEIELLDSIDCQWKSLVLLILREPSAGGVPHELWDGLVTSSGYLGDDAEFVFVKLDFRHD